MLTRETHFGTNNEAVGRWWGSMRVQDVAASDQRRDQTMGHWRAISPGVARSMTVTGGASDDQVRAVRGPDLSDSQADSAGSIPVTRSARRACLRIDRTWRWATQIAAGFHRLRAAFA